MSKWTYDFSPLVAQRILPAMNGDCMNVFLAELSSRYPHHFLLVACNYYEAHPEIIHSMTAWNWIINSSIENYRPSLVGPLVKPVSYLSEPVHDLALGTQKSEVFENRTANV